MAKHVYFWAPCAQCGAQRRTRVDDQHRTCRSCAAERSKTHGLASSPLYEVYKSMLARCGHIASGYQYKHNYEGRGITVCDAWRESRISFFEWAMANGYKKGLQLDRRDNEKGYSPENCQFVVPAVNARNRRTAKLTKSDVIAIKTALASAKLGTIARLAEIYGVSSSTISEIKTRKIWADV